MLTAFFTAALLFQPVDADERTMSVARQERMFDLASHTDICESRIPEGASPQWYMEHGFQSRQEVLLLLQICVMQSQSEIRGLCFDSPTNETCRRQPRRQRRPFVSAE